MLEFEKALSAHAQKYHTGDWKWRVWAIQSGPDANGYHITEGPLSWDLIDGRGEISTEHNNDWNKNVAVYITDRGGASYSVFEDISFTELSYGGCSTGFAHTYRRGDIAMSVRYRI